jgi:DNA-binding CsgD family transcriptional regulator
MFSSPELTAAVGDLRRRIIDGARGSAPAPMLDCAAHMLLYADDLEAVEHIALRHLLDRFDATRVDLGFASPGADDYVSVASERRGDCEVPNPVGVRLPNRDHGIQVVWRSSRPVYLDIERDPLLSRMRALIRGRFGTRSKLARRLEHAGEHFGLVCIDDTEERHSWNEADQAYFDRFVRGFLSPILYEIRAIQPRPVSGSLTETEKAVVRLATLGLSYKEIARRLGKSPNTVDNQLRRIRFKLGVHNQVELVRASSSLI